MTDGAQPCGVLLLDKPKGPTSHDMVGKVRRLYNTKKVGHTGTLDPMATGLLIVLVGRAAKAAEYLSLDDKRYSAVLTLGCTTDTEDITGKKLTESEDIPKENEVRAVCSRFLGKTMQIPPMYSALKVGGQKLYDIARRGGTVEREPREIEIYSLETRKTDDKNYTLEVHCSKGTYIRTLCADIGAALGCGGVMGALRRTACGGFSISEAHTPEELEAMSEAERAGVLLPCESLFSELPILRLPGFFERLCRNGAEIYEKKIGADYPAGTRLRLYGAGGFFALGEVFEYGDGRAVKAVKNFDIE